MGFTNTIPPIDPHLKSWMLFVDGENITMRGQAIAAEYGISLRAGSHWERDVFLWLPGVKPHELMTATSDVQTQKISVRPHYYTSMEGTEEKLEDMRKRLWELGFNPEIFRKRRRAAKSKGVDISLTKDMLSHAHRGSYEVAVLLSGDGDYVPLVDEVKRVGRIVFVGGFFESGMNSNLVLSSDWAFDLENAFLRAWMREFGADEADLTKPLPPA